MRRKFAAAQRREFPQGEFSSPEDLNKKGSRGACPVGKFITCCEEEKLEGLEGGRAFQVKNGECVMKI